MAIRRERSRNDAPRGGRRTALRLAGSFVALAALAAAGGSAPPASAEPEAPRWESRTSGLAVKGVTALRIPSKGADVWYASVFGSRTARMGFCETRDKGKKWRTYRHGFEESPSDRDHYEITLDPKEEKTFYVVTRGKIYRTITGGVTFDNVSSGTQTFSLDRSQQKSFIAGVAVDPSNGKHLFAGTIVRGYYGGLFESKDGAKSWTQIAGTGDRKDLQDSNLGTDAWPISLDRSDKFVLVGGTTVSASASDDRGVHFKVTQPGVHRAYDLTSMNSGEVFLAESRGLWRSRDHGGVWGKEPLLAGTCLSTDVDPGNRRQVYAVIRGQGLYRTDNLTKWEGPKHQELDPHGVVVHPNAKNTVFLLSSTTGLWISEDRGETFRSVSEQLPDAVPAITHVAAHPTDSRQMLATTDTGFVFASQDGGATWTRPGNVGEPVTRLLGVPGVAGAWIAAGRGVHVSLDLGATWTATLTSQSFEDRVVDLVHLPEGSWYALWERDGRIAVSRDAGKTWDTKAFDRPTSKTSVWATALAVDPRDAKHLLVSFRTTADAWSKDDRDGGPYESKDGGATWAQLEAGFRSDKNVWREGWNRGVAVAIDANGAMLYFADGVGAFRMAPAAPDAKAAWVEVSMTGVPAQPRLNAFLASQLPDGATEVLMQLEGLTTRSTVRSVDGGATWAAAPDPGMRVVAFAVDPNARGRWLTGDTVGDLGVLVYGTPGAAPPTPLSPVDPDDKPPPPAADAKQKPVAGLVAFAGGADKSLRAFDLHAGALRGTAAAADGEVLSIVVTKDDARVYSGSAAKAVQLWKAQDVSSLGRVDGHGGGVGALALSPDGATLYAGDDDFKIVVWDTTTGKASARWERHGGAVTALAVSPNGTRVYSASRDKTVRIWESPAGKEALVVSGHPAEVLALALSKDGSHLYTGGRDGTVRVFDAKTGAPLATWAVRLRAITSLALAPDGLLLYAAGDGETVESILVADGTTATSHTGAGDKGNASVAVSADGRWIVAGGGDGVVRLWRATKAEPMWASANEGTGAIFAVALSSAQGDPLPGAPGATEPPAPPPTPAPPTPAPPTPAPAPGPTPAPPPAMGETPPVPPAMGDAPAPPAMGEAPPAPPAMGETPPAPPAMGEVPPAMSETPPKPAMGS